jgi:uncharacterized protein (DUF488 family)
VEIWTIGHGRRPIEELLACLESAAVLTLIDVRRYPSSRRNPQYNQDALAGSLAAAGIGYRHALELGGRLHGEPGAERFPCLEVPAFASYAARMGIAAWWRCHRRLIADLLAARGHEVFHLMRPHETRRHRLGDEAEARGGRLYICGELVA